MPRYGALRQRFPDADIRIVTASALTYAEFDTPEIDLSIRFGDGKWANYQAEMLYRERAYPAASRAYVSKHSELQKADAAEALQSHRLLDLDNGRLSGLSWRRWLFEFGCTAKHSQLAKFPSHMMLTQAALRGEGVALFWHGIHDDLFAGGDLVRVGAQSVETNAGFFLVARALERQPVQGLVDFFLKSRAETHELLVL